jgi:hypothetical protein
MLLFLLLMAVQTPAASPVVLVEEVRMHVGDDPTWATPQFDDGLWKLVAFEDVPHPNDVVWMRARVDLRPLERQPGHPIGIHFGGLASHELWWDGERIGGSGVVARNRSEERPGKLESQVQIPDRLATPAIHTLAVRASAFHRGFAPRNGYWNIVIGDYDLLRDLHTRRAHRAMFALSGIALTAVFAFAMFFLARRDKSFLLLGTLSLAAAALLIAEAWRSLFGYPYDWHIVRLRCVVALSWIVGVHLVALLITRFPHRRGRAVLFATAALVALPPFVFRGWDPKSLYIFLVCCSVALAWAVFAVVRRMHGSALALIGTGVVAIALFVDPYAWVDNVLYLALNFLCFCLLCSHALEVRREQQEKARLQLEIVRRYMQPHFVMNTLTALSEWIEQEPKTAVRMIESLSDELRILGAMSMQTLVPIAEELRLCRSHLVNMSLRKDVAYELVVNGVEGDWLVPPVVFHTLVENAITHGAASERVTMSLSAHADRDSVHYRFEAPMDPSDEREPKPGSGTRYIEARLREAWGSDWSLRQEAVGDRWCVELEMPTKRACDVGDVAAATLLGAAS